MSKVYTYAGQNLVYEAYPSFSSLLIPYDEVCADILLTSVVNSHKSGFRVEEDSKTIDHVDTTNWMYKNNDPRIYGRLVELLEILLKRTDLVIVIRYR